MTLAVYTSNNCFSLVTFAAAQRFALLQRIDEENRGFSANELDQMDAFGEAVAFAPARCEADALAKVEFAGDLADLLDDDVGDASTAGKLVAAKRSAVAYLQMV